MSEEQYQDNEQQPITAQPPQGQPLPTAPKPRPGGNITTQGLMEGALMTALAVILSVISTFVPLLQMVSPLLFPLPIAILTVRQGVKLGTLSAVSSFLLCAILLGLPQALSLVIEFGAMGLFLGYCFRAERKALFTLGGATMLGALGMAVQIALTIVVAGLPVTFFLDSMLASVDMFVDTVIAQGAEGMFFGAMTAEQYRETMAMLMERILPAGLIVGSMLLALCCYLVFRKVMQRLGYQAQNLPPFQYWRLDWRYLWLLIIAMAASGLGSRLDIDWLARIGDNLLYICMPIFLTIGVSILIWLFKRLRVNNLVKVLAVILAVQMFLWTFWLLMLLGVFDAFVDFRAWMQKRWFSDAKAAK